jgi:ABC-type Mn2+/Zn2+ transport system ATPase subunit
MFRNGPTPQNGAAHHHNGSVHSHERPDTLPNQSPGPLIEFRGVGLAYDRQPVVTGIDLAIEAGDFVGLVGPSGAGKTTLLRAMLGLVPRVSGAITIEGRSAGRRASRSIGYVPQLETVDWNFPVTVEEVVAMGAALTSGPWPWINRGTRARIGEVLGRLGIGDLRKRHIRNLSGGQQQRVFLARALIRQPAALLLDEPTAGVDIKTRDDILHLLAELNRQGITIVLTTHDLNSVAAHLPRVVCVNRRIVAAGAPDEVFTEPILSRTYGAEMRVIRHEGLLLVSDAPHPLLGRTPAPEPALAGREGEAVGSRQ